MEDFKALLSMYWVIISLGEDRDCGELMETHGRRHPSITPPASAYLLIVSHKGWQIFTDVPSLKHISLYPYLILSYQLFTLWSVTEEWGLESCINDQSSEACFHSKVHASNRFFSSRFLKNLPWGRQLEEGDLRSIENKQRWRGYYFSV